LGSWARTVAAAIAVVAIFGIVAGLALTGRLVDLRHANIPLVRPWPPAGSIQNPFNPTDRGDVMDRATADRVAADLLADGQVELQALRSGDGSNLTQADAGNNLTRLRSVLARNKTDGVTEDIANQITRTTVGRLTDPNNASITWCVEEVGTSRVTYTRTADGSVTKTELFKFVDRFWLVERGGHFLISDVQVSSQVVAP